MRVEELRRMYELEDSYWWFVGRRRILRAWLRRTLRAGGDDAPRALDVGCGAGANLDLLHEFREALGVDAEEPALRFCAERGLTGLAQARGEALPFAEGTFRLVTALEVLEHIPAHEHAASEAYRVLEPGGTFLVTVPAYRWLWSDHDVALDHCRRYTRRELTQLLRGAGFEVRRLSHCVSLLLPLTVLFRLGQRLLQALRGPRPEETRPTSGLVLVPRWLSGLFVATLGLEAWWLGIGGNLPLGVTLVAEAVRPQSPKKRDDGDEEEQA